MRTHGNTSKQLSGAEAAADIQHWIHYDTRFVEWFSRLTLGPWCKLVYRHRAYGVGHVPKDGPFIMVPNHSSYMDPFLLMVSHRLVRFMAKSTLFDNPVLRALTAGGGGFPVRRGAGDTFAMDVARMLLADGQAVAVFPEGTRFRDSDELGPARRGVARIALETGDTVVPVAIYGAKPRRARGHATFPPRLPRITVVYGEQMQFDGDATVDDVRDEIWDEVTRLYGIARDLNHRRVRPLRFDVPRRAANARARERSLTT